jgi:hypothetical protein
MVRVRLLGCLVRCFKSDFEGDRSPVILGGESGNCDLPILKVIQVEVVAGDYPQGVGVQFKPHAVIH